MNYRTQKRKAESIAADIAAAQLARIVAAGLAISLAIKGDWIGASVLAVAAAVLWLALPVTR